MRRPTSGTNHELIQVRLQQINKNQEACVKTTIAFQVSKGYCNSAIPAGDSRQKGQKCTA